MGTKNPGIWPIPAGTKDLLPGEAKRRRVLENQLAELFESQGFEEVITPTLEFFETMAVELGDELENQLYRLFDRDGRLLVLRPDMTTPIARLAATRMRHLELPLRLFYLSNVFRYESPQAGRMREFGQAGVELIGQPESSADAEIIALSVKALHRAGLEDFQISLGQIPVFNAIMDESRLPENAVRQIKGAIARKDLVGLERALDQHRVVGGQKELILEFSDLQGGRGVLSRAKSIVNSDYARQAIDRLEEVFDHLGGLGVEESVQLDLGLLRGFDYYTGIVFEGYTTDLGFTICGGGRYDNLLEKFGYPCPAIGFALGLDRLLLARANQQER
jgi:ATP phosphoribosyltransferase regulatory subunit